MLRHNWKHPEEADEAWSLQESVAFVITAPGSLYNPSRSDYHQRWDKLAKRFLEELESAQTKQLPINSSNVSRQHYATAPWATGGMFPEMTDVLTLFKSVNDVIQGLSGWLDLAALVGLLPRAWGRAQAAEGEGSEGSFQELGEGHKQPKEKVARAGAVFHRFLRYPESKLFASRTWCGMSAFRKCRRLP